MIKVYDFFLENKEYLSNNKFYYENKKSNNYTNTLGSFDEESIAIMMICFDKNEQNFNIYRKMNI